MSEVIKSNNESFNDIIKGYDPLTNRSKNIMTKYEKTVVIGIRLEQLAFGGQSTLNEEELQDFTNIKDIVMEELLQKKIPFIIRRTLPNQSYEYWRIEDMIIMP
jgi:DNA-directed RNA polymerase I, II, and III subunit RPABC2